MPAPSLSRWRRSPSAPAPRRASLRRNSPSTRATPNGSSRWLPTTTTTSVRWDLPSLWPESFRMEDLNEEQESLVARDLGEPRNGGGSGSRPQIYEAHGDWECGRRECREASISENGLRGDPGPHTRQRSETAGQAGFPVSRRRAERRT